jgi:hypothetical protein
VTEEPEDFHEIWWIYSPAEDAEWAGLRIAHFRKTADGHLFVFIQGELPKRVGPRLWEDITVREQWVKVKQILVPTTDEIRAAL